VQAIVAWIGGADMRALVIALVLLLAGRLGFR
jgi:hypothetical protein